MTWRHFTLSEFSCKHCGENKIDHAFVDKLDALRDVCGFALPVTSGYRCPEHNAKVSSTGLNGPHTTGHAVDFGVRGQQALTVMQLALARGGFYGIGLNQKGAARFVHLDDLPNAPGQPRPTCWTY